MGIKSYAINRSLENSQRETLVVWLSSSEWFDWMLRAIQLASLAEGSTSPNPLVGAVVLDKDGNCTSTEFYLSIVKPRAEITQIHIDSLINRYAPASRRNATRVPAVY